MDHLMKRKQFEHLKIDPPTNLRLCWNNNLTGKLITIDNDNDNDHW